jgi:hypothetical protein
MIARTTSPKMCRAIAQVVIYIASNAFHDFLTYLSGKYSHKQLAVSFLKALLGRAIVKGVLITLTTAGVTEIKIQLELINYGLDCRSA